MLSISDRRWRSLARTASCSQACCYAAASGARPVSSSSGSYSDGEYTVRFGEREKTLIVPSLPCNACDWKPYDAADLDCYQVCD